MVEGEGRPDRLMIPESSREEERGEDLKQVIQEIVSSVINDK